jgi:3-methyl-2-oxobutanoate hydroxymethyltransferase|tara:strand:- start:372 stop:1202 length:831 start_codon:yes stop_codon:yes gene_type:complete
MKANGQKISAITSYDYSFAKIANEAEIDIILVGDSGAMVMFGYENTSPATMDEMLLMSKAVSRGGRKSLLVGDMPFMSYHVSSDEAVRNAGRFIKEGGMQAVKIEGGLDVAKTVRVVTKAGIPVMGHIGLQPQMAQSWDGYRVQGTDYTSAKQLIEDAQELEQAGAFCIVLEMITKEVSKIITNSLSIPTIGIGSGPYCDGQILVLHDLLNLYDSLKPKFVKKYADLKTETFNALTNYKTDVSLNNFPSNNHSWSLDNLELKKLKKYFGEIKKAKI